MPSKTLRVLSIDGGGMRGLYTCSYLAALSEQMAARRKCGPLDVGKAFGLIAGTSTGGIIACALAAGVPLSKVATLYRQHGNSIFPLRMPSKLGLDLICQLQSRPKHLANGSNAFAAVLREVLGEETIGQVYDRRGIALAIPAVEMSRHRSWVFKTSHLGGHRDDGFSLADVCLATSAAPLFRSLARVPNPSAPSHFYVFADGGLWANNPVLVALIDALGMTEKGDRIELYALGTCPRPEGDIIGENEIHRGLPAWGFGGKAASLAIDAQEFAYENMARMIAGHVERDCHVVRFPQGDLPANAMRFLDLDETSDEGMRVLTEQAHADVSDTLSMIDRVEDQVGQMLANLFGEMPIAIKEG